MGVNPSKEDVCFEERNLSGRAEEITSKHSKEKCNMEVSGKSRDNAGGQHVAAS